jgi:FkbM family methyltransferase
VGANLGYTSLLFSSHVDHRQSVIAFEPDRENYQALCESVRKRKAIVPVWAAVGEVDGEVQFWTNPGHHADSRTVTDAFGEKLENSQAVYSVPLVSIDSYLGSKHSGAKVSLIKIDVQGYEEKVLRGCEQTLAANPSIVVAFEFSPGAARELGFDPEFQLSFFLERGFNLYSLSRRHGLRSFSRQEVQVLVRQIGYCDIVASRTPLLGSISRKG